MFLASHRETNKVCKAISTFIHIGRSAVPGQE